ncbi:MAG: GNAT family N-acetyltransferase [Eubacteriales bacterium]|nr:GNAT family N-acetyltransferase [Eubacteriales bacterium]
MLTFERVTAFPRGTLAKLLIDGYAFDPRCAEHWQRDWYDFDAFFYDHPEIADRYGFISTLNGQPIGLASWDPRRLPDHVEIGHNCIVTSQKYKGFGSAQLREAVSRILMLHPQRILVTTSGNLLPAQRMYESVGFELQQRRTNSGADSFSGDYLDYCYRPVFRPTVL